jgi:hypothetical protein
MKAEVAFAGALLVPARTIAFELRAGHLNIRAVLLLLSRENITDQYGPQFW